MGIQQRFRLIGVTEYPTRYPATYDTGARQINEIRKSERSRHKSNGNRKDL